MEIYQLGSPAHGGFRSFGQNGGRTVNKAVERLLLGLLFTLFPSAIFPQTRSGLEKTATSAITTRRENDGSITAIITNKRFTFTWLSSEGAPESQGRTLLLLEEFKSERNLASEGQRSFVTVQAWSGPGADPSRSLWRFKTEGDEGVLTDRFYKVTKHGCCGAEDTFIFFNALTGRKLFTATSDLFEVEVPNTPLLRLVAYQSMMASIPAFPESGKKIIGLLQYGSEKELLQTVIVRSRAKKVEDTGTPKIKMLYRGKLEPENRLMLWGVDKKNNPAALSGFSIVLSFDEGQDVVIPVKTDHLDLKSARIPKGLLLEAPALVK